MKKKPKLEELERSSRWMVAVFGTLGGYALAEVLLMGKPHPWHWLAALAIGAVGFVIIAVRQRRQYRR